MVQGCRRVMRLNRLSRRSAPATTTTYYEDEDMNKEPFYITYLRAAAIIFSIFTLMEWFIE